MEDTKTPSDLPETPYAFLGTPPGPSGSPYPQDSDFSLPYPAMRLGERDILNLARLLASQYDRTGPDCLLMVPEYFPFLSGSERIVVISRMSELIRDEYSNRLHALASWGTDPCTTQYPHGPSGWGMRDWHIYQEAQLLAMAIHGPTPLYPSMRGWYYGSLRENGPNNCPSYRDYGYAPPVYDCDGHGDDDDDHNDDHNDDDDEMGEDDPCIDVYEGVEEEDEEEDGGDEELSDLWGDEEEEDIELSCSYSSSSDGEVDPLPPLAVNEMRAPSDEESINPAEPEEGSDDDYPRQVDLDEEDDMVE